MRTTKTTANKATPRMLCFACVILATGAFVILSNLTQLSLAQRAEKLALGNLFSLHSQSAAALTPTLPQSSCVTPPAGMVAWYPGDGNALDLQGGDSGTVSGSGGAVTFPAGKVAQTFQFNGGSDVRVVDSPALEATTALTLDAWVNPTTGNDFSQIVFKGESFGSYALFLRSDRTVNFRIGNPASTPVVDAVDSITQIPLDSYTHIAGTYDGTTLSIYINGVLDASKTTTVGTLADYTTPLIIGNGYLGAIDELEIFNRALAQSEIQAIVAADSAGKCKNPPTPPPPPTACITPPANMTVWFTGDGNTLDTQGGDSATHAQAPGTVTFVPGKVAQAFQFNGGDLRVADAPAQDVTNALTLDAWVKPADVAQNQSFIVFKGNTNTVDGQPYSLLYDSTFGHRRIFFRVGNNSTLDSLASITEIPLDTYTHVAATYDGTRMRLYINGNLDAIKTTTIGTLANSDLPLIIGGYQGIVDELEIYNRVLLLSEIQLLFAADSFGKCKPPPVPVPTPTSCVTPPAGMAAWYPFDGDTHDIQNGNDGNLVGIFAPGKVAQAIQFDGSYGVVVGDNVIGQNPTTALTLDAWINPIAGNDFGTIVYKGEGFGSYALFMNGNRTVNFRIGNPASTPIVDAFDSFAQIPLDAYTHIAATYDGTRMRLYINGNLDTVKTTTIGALADSDAALYIGALAQFVYRGAIDELEIFPRVLSEAEIKLLFAAGSFGKCKCQPITLSPASLPGGTVNAPYSQTVTASGGTGPYTFAITSGSLPPGLSLDSSSGQISGTATTAGTFNFGVTATDANSCPGSRSYSITVNCPTITLSPASLPNGTVGTPYNQTISAAGTSGPFTFSVTSGALPDGLSLNSNGQLSGTPTTVGPFDFSVTATDAGAGCSGSRAYTLTIDACSPTQQDLVSWWPGEGNANDSAGSNGGVLTGNVSFVPGQVGQAFSFINNGYVEVPDSTTLEPTNVTAEAWVRHNGAPGSYKYILSKGSRNTFAASYAIYAFDYGLHFYIYDGNTSYYLSPPSDASVWDGQWHHIVGTFDGQRVRLYVDGLQVGNGNLAPIAIGYNLPTTEHFAIGTYARFTSTYNFPGDVDEVRIYNRALSLSEIRGNFGHCEPPPAPTPTPTPNTLPGNNVTVQTSSGDARATFAGVTDPGETLFAIITPPSSAGTPPSGYTVLNDAPAYDIRTTASYTSPVTVCFIVSSINNEADFARVRILHGENGPLVDRTILAPDNPAPDFPTRTVCARVNSLSPFVAALAPATPTASNGSVSGRIVANDGTPVEGAVVMLSGTQNRKFITDVNGFYRFEQVETGGFYTVTPSRVNYTLTPSSRSFSQLGETTEAAFGATLTSGGFINPLDTPEYFVRQHYLDFLGREPDESGFNFWSEQIRECGADAGCAERRRINVSAAYFLSIEFQQTGGLVDGLYRASYGVRPQFAEFMPDTRTVARDVVVGRQGWQAKLEANKQAFVDAFVQRSAFHAAYDGLSNSGYVDALISRAAVSFTSGEREALVSGLASGTLTRSAVLRSIAEDGRFVSAKSNETFVMMEYFGYLRRDPDESGYQFWLQKLNQFNGNFELAEMVKAFIVSSEYRTRFPR